jgi:hypothetical protein
MRQLRASQPEKNEIDLSVLILTPIVHSGGESQLVDSAGTTNLKLRTHPIHSCPSLSRNLFHHRQVANYRL